MSDIPQTDSLRQQISGRWQIPLLVLAVMALTAGVWRLLPRPAPPTFDELFAGAVELFEAGFYPEASEYIETLLLDPERPEMEQRQLHGLLARVIFEHETTAAVPGKGNAERVITHSDRALAEGASHDGPTHRMRGRAFEWLRRPADALTAYREAVARGVADVWPVRRDIIEIQRAIGGVPAETLHDAYDVFLSDADVPEELRYWAAEAKVELFGRQRKHADAERFLAVHAERFRDTDFGGEYDYLQAVAWFHVGRLDEAEAQLRSLCNRLSWADALYARASYQLGRILQAQEAPAFALSFYEDVIAKADPGPYRTAAWLGKAEALAGLERFDESVEAYHETVRLATDDPYSGLVDLRAIRESTTDRYRELLETGRPTEALAYLRIGSTLAPPADAEKQAFYAARLASLAADLGRSAQASAPPGEAGQAARDEARRYLLEAGEEYLRLAGLLPLDDGQSADAVWRAADAFDSGGDRRRTAEVLEAFVADHPLSNRVAPALLHLGQTYQALGQFDQAVLRYQQNLTEFPETLFAVASIVPLADCFVELGQPDEAEAALLRLVDYRQDESLHSVTPTAGEYRDALFRLGDLYLQSGRFERAIARYEEALEQHEDDARVVRTAFMLAEAYRRSADRIHEDMKDPKNVAYKDHLRATYRNRLALAEERYREVIDRQRASSADVSGAPDPANVDLDALYVKLSHFGRADAVYDRGRVAEPSDHRPYAEALELYDRAAWLYAGDPMAMTAHLQMINCHLRMGNVDEARRTLQRALYALRTIPDEAFERHVPDEGRDYWQRYLSQLERTPTFVVAEARAVGRGPGAGS